MKSRPQDFDVFGHVLHGIVVPRPIAFVSTISAEGVPNLAPFSFYMAVASRPPTLAVSVSRSAGWKPKDTLANIEATGEFVVNVTVDGIAGAMNDTAADYPSDVSEFDVAGLTPVPSDTIGPPRVAESPVNMECRVSKIIPIGEEERESALVLGEVLLVYIRDDIVDGHRIDHQALNPTGRLAGSLYCRTLDVFEMVRPTYTHEG